MKQKTEYAFETPIKHHQTTAIRYEKGDSDGFDHPLLHTMYVDKRLCGQQASPQGGLRKDLV